ncbi:hypothetical protein P261_02862 [Lachnospiraceae bacterium TWA4]|nr:hypothetical protein P261_02862 [Lachnospiraceae bacterium TWA4]
MKKIIIKMLCIFLMLIMLTNLSTSVFAMENASLVIQNKIKSINEVNIKSYTSEFINSMYNDLNFKLGKVITIYNEDDDISGYCIDVMKENSHNGYIVVKFSNNKPVISEFAIESEIENPYDQIIKNSKITNKELKFYSIDANEYQVLDKKSKLVYDFNLNKSTEKDFKKYKENVQIEKQSELINTNNEEKSVNYAKLDGWTVISDSYSGTRKSGDSIEGGGITYYGTKDVKSIKKTYACAVVALCNLMKYYKSQKYTKISSSLSSLYSSLWKYAETDSSGETKNKNIPKAAKKYLESLGYKCSYNTNWNLWYSTFVRDIKNNKPSIFAYGAKFGNKEDGHAVLVIGYTETTDYQYLRVADGWNSYFRYLNFNGYKYSRRSAWSFSVSK